MKSSFIVALLGFAVLNALLTFGTHGIERYHKLSDPWSPNKSRAWWSLKTFETQPTPDVVLMGSSLMMCATDCADALAFKSIESKCWAHPCMYLIAKLQALLSLKSSNFCFALPGETPSDAWCIAHTALINDKKPKVIIYGITPADFLNCCFLGPTHTETFKLMHRVGDCSDVELEDVRNRWDRLDYEFEHHIWLYRHRTDFLFATRRLTDFVLEDVYHQDMTRNHLPVALKLQLGHELPERFFPNDSIEDFSQVKADREALAGAPGKTERSVQESSNNPTVAPTTVNLPAIPKADPTQTAMHNESVSAAQNLAFEENIRWYTFMFSKVNEYAYEEQMLCLTRIAAYCQINGVKLILVNMPVTREHYNLISPDNYRRYFRDVIAIAKQRNATFVDMLDTREFPTRLFLDSNHLNNEGATKFWDLLVPRIAYKIAGAVDHRNLVGRFGN